MLLADARPTRRLAVRCCLFAESRQAEAKRSGVRRRGARLAGAGAPHDGRPLAHHLLKGMRRGLLLPQVATEWGWTSDQFLRQTCRKAGLADDAWQHGAQVYRFEADVFGE